ncbi:MAG: hypothetical protein QM757_24050 [Paludibaculum sp.]
MGYQKRIVCLANSRKPGGRCVAGKETIQGGYGSWIRPVSARPGAEVNVEERQYENGGDPSILDILDISMLAPVPKVHQVENHMIDPHFYWTRRGAIGWEDIAGLVDAPVTLWGTGVSTYHGHNDQITPADAAAFQNSLCLVQPENLSIQVLTPGAAFGNNKRKVRASFRYRGVPYNLMVTDPSVENAFLARPNGDYPIHVPTYLSVSLTEAHTDNYCYKLIATVISEQPL